MAIPIQVKLAAKKADEEIRAILAVGAEERRIQRELVKAAEEQAKLRKAMWRYRRFIYDLERLSRHHGVVLNGCGCCGSPWLSVMTDEQRHRAAGYAMSSQADWVTWATPEDRNLWAKYRESIVKPRRERMP